MTNAERYAIWLCDNVIAPQWNAGTDALVAAGGGWLLVESFIKARYPERLILTPDQVKHTRGIALYDLNGVGGGHCRSADAGDRRRQCLRL